MIVAIDGTSTDLSLALAEPDGEAIGAVAWSASQRQSAELLPRLLRLADEVGREIGGVTIVAVGTGPGSFTGLRVAMALAKGLALGYGRPIVGIPSLPAWLAAEPPAVAALARAGAREAYLLRRGDETPLIVDRDELPDQAPTARVVAPAELADAFGLENAARPNGAAVMARMAAERLSTDPGGDDLAALEPLYVRMPRGVAAASVERIQWL